MKSKCQIVIVGGGAGGLVLATLLGNRLGKNINIILVNSTLTYLWKPLLHEVAAGTLNSHEDEINLIAHAHAHHFQFQWGEMIKLDRTNKKIFLAPILDINQQEILPARDISYDILIIAVGSKTNDFHIPGVLEHCYFLDTLEEAKNFQQRFLKYFISSQKHHEKKDYLLNIAIVGGGATGIELAAELHYANQEASRYGISYHQKNLITQITIIEASSSILSNLPQQVIRHTLNELTKRKITIHQNQKVLKVDASGLYTHQQLFIPAHLKIWAAGIKAPEFLKNLDGLETNHLNQLVVKPTLQTTKDENIFAFGDCAYFEISFRNPIPPRAQAAQQQAYFLSYSIERYLNNKSLLQFHYRDYGALISLSSSQAIGNLQGQNIRLLIRGWFAYFIYRFLYRKYQAALHGWWRTFLVSVADRLSTSVKARLKLH